MLRYVNKDCDIQEWFVGMVTFQQTDSQAIVSAIESVLTRHNLKIEDIRSQGYDGAANNFFEVSLLG